MPGYRIAVILVNRMGMITFFPWFTIDAPLSFGKFKLFPHNIGQASIYGVPAVIDNVVDHYRLNPKLAVRKICVLQYGEKPFGEDFSDAERAEIFEFAEILAMGGLSKRRFFVQPNPEYTNRDTVTGVIQGFREADGGVAVRSRLRYGSNLTYFTDDAYLVLCPHHVHANQTVKFDTELVSALLAAFGGGGVDHIEAAIKSYGQANTDNSQTPEYVELIHLNGSFEALFDLGKGNEHDLARAFLDCLSSHTEATLPPSKRQQARFTKSSSSRDTWIRDLFRTRGSVAHGRSDSGYTAVWSVGEHLLLGAFIFPLCLKIALERKGFYKLTEDDLLAILTFDHLLRSENLYEQIPDKTIDELPDLEESVRRMMKKWVWTEISSAAFFARRREKAIAKITGDTSSS